ncbi:glycosyltransferase family 4 protein, partial [bacterium]|nr:glycosyltransferase family 4 protein [bacterium]
YMDKIGINEEKVITIYNGIAVEHLHTNADITTEYGSRPGARIIGTIGRLTLQKGLKYLIHAVAIAIKQIPQIELLIVGDGTEKKNLVKLVSDLGIRERVIFTGFQKDVGSFLRTMEIFILPSLFEGLPGVVLEAMAFQRPVVATRIAGVDEVVVDEETGVLVPPRNPEALAGAIIKLLSDREKAREMGIRGREKAEKYFNIGLMVEKYEKVYDELAHPGIN